MEFLIVCPLAFLAGLIDAVAGGGGLISLPAYFFAGLPTHAAIATNKLSSIMGTAVVTLRYAFFGYMVKRFVAVGVACGLFGSFLGSNLVLATDGELLMAFMLASLPLVAALVLKTKDFDRFSEDPYPVAKGVAITAVIALAVGVYDGFYGPGTGTFLMLLLTSVGHQSTKEAQGTSKAINLATNAAGLAVFLSSGNVWVALGLAAGLFNVVGGWIGSGLFRSKGASIVRPVMIVVIALFAARLVFDLVQ